VYFYGASEELVGRTIRRYTRRADVVLATKLRLSMHDGPSGSGRSRNELVAADGEELLRAPQDGRRGDGPAPSAGAARQFGYPILSMVSSGTQPSCPAALRTQVQPLRSSRIRTVSTSPTLVGSSLVSYGRVIPDPGQL
jgi:hypothetical protein